MTPDLDFGSLNDALARSTPVENFARSVNKDLKETFPEAVAEHLADITGHQTHNLLHSAGPISDAYILGRERRMLITGPGASGKTTASVKKSLVEGQRIRPGSDGVRRYVLGVWRQKYDNLWKATIPSWWKILPKDLLGSKWVGASPRAAEHIVNFEDAWGPVQLVARFRAFGDVADPEDLLGNEMTDCYLNEWSTLPEELSIALSDRVGRDPPPAVIGRAGRFFGDSNAPDVLNYIYRDFYEDPKEGYKLYRQPGGLAPDAENIGTMGRDYYTASARDNAHNPWWVKRMVHAKPGFTRSVDPVYPQFDDDRNMSTVTLDHFKELPIMVGVDGGMTPAAVYAQEKSDGQLRVLAEVALARGGMRELSVAMLALEEQRFPGCDFATECDPSMNAGDDLEEGSDRSRLSSYLGREVNLSRTNNPDERWESIRSKIRHTVDNGVPGLAVDPSCKGVRRGFNQTYAFRKIQGTNDRGSVDKSFDSHVHDALQVVGLMCGTSAARMRTNHRVRERKERQEQSRKAGRYNPNSYAHKRAR